MNYNITKLPQNTQTFIAGLSSMNKSRQLPVSIALARLIANHLPLPSAEVECIETLYNTQHAVEVQLQLGSLNELILIDIDTVNELIKKFYSFRYNNVYSCDHLLLRRETAVLDFFKVTKYFDEVSIKCIDENHSYIAELTLRFIELFECLKGN